MGAEGDAVVSDDGKKIAQIIIRCLKMMIKMLEILIKEK
jgi:hypothetical protein